MSGTDNLFFEPKLLLKIFFRIYSYLYCINSNSSFLKTNSILFIACFTVFLTLAQNQKNLGYFVEQAKTNLPALKENSNLLKIGELQNSIITAQNKAFLLNA
uniref:hypothetical protein n=1 Tax=Mariniflexile sp. TaxID=1979402 RepID=UPI0040474E7E